MDRDECNTFGLVRVSQQATQLRDQMIRSSMEEVENAAEALHKKQSSIPRQHIVTTLNMIDQLSAVIGSDAAICQIKKRASDSLSGDTAALEKIPHFSSVTGLRYYLSGELTRISDIRVEVSTSYCGITGKCCISLSRLHNCCENIWHCLPKKPLKSRYHVKYAGNWIYDI